MGGYVYTLSHKVISRKRLIKPSHCKERSDVAICSALAARLINPKGIKSQITNSKPAEDNTIRVQAVVLHVKSVEFVNICTRYLTLKHIVKQKKRGGENLTGYDFCNNLHMNANEKTTIRIMFFTPDCTYIHKPRECIYRACPVKHIPVSLEASICLNYCKSINSSNMKL